MELKWEINNFFFNIVNTFNKVLNALEYDHGCLARWNVCNVYTYKYQMSMLCLWTELADCCLSVYIFVARNRSRIYLHIANRFNW